MRQPAVPATKAVEPSTVRLAEFLSPHSVSLSLKATEKPEILEELVSLLPLSDVDRRIALGILGQREAVGSTGIGMGVAIPHCRSAIFANLQIAFARSPRGIAYQAIDRKRVQLFFLVVSPPIEVTNQYHAVLAAIVNVTKDAHNRKRLLEAESAVEVRSILGGAA